MYASRITDAPGPDNYTQKVGPAGKLTGQDYMNSYFLQLEHSSLFFVFVLSERFKTFKFMTFLNIEQLAELKNV